MCDCKQKLEELMRYHKSCSRNVRYETVTPIQKIIELKELFQEIKIPETPIIPPPSPEIIKEVVKETSQEFIDEIQETSQDETRETSQEDEYEEEDDTVELTDVSPEELQAQEEEEKRIRDELALIELTKLTKKKVRSKK